MSDGNSKKSWTIAFGAISMVAQILLAASPTLQAPITESRQRVPTGGVLHDQLDMPAGAGFASQDFEPAASSFDCEAADDFVVPAADAGWDVAGVSAAGAYILGAGPTPLLNVTFYADAAGAPGATVPGCDYVGLVAGVDFVDDGAGNLDVTLPAICDLSPGAYWVSVQADMDSTVVGQWIWGERSVQNGNPFQWENPGDGFLTGCTSWTAGTSCGASAPDLLFALSGAIVPVELQSFSVE